MKRLAKTIGLLVLALIASGTIFAQGGVIASTTADVWMRVGPGTEWRRLEVLQAGMNIAIDGRDTTAFWVRGIAQTGTVGWVSADYVTLDRARILELPYVDREEPITVGAPPPGAVQSAPAAPAEEGAPPPAAVDIDPIVSTAPVRGFSYGGHVRPFDDRTINYMRQAGMTWVKKQVRYNQGDDPGGWAEIINGVHAQGFRILLGVVGSPSQVLNDGYFNQYAGYVAGLAAMGADAIEVWNEPNLDREWPTGQVDPGRYTQLLATAYNAIKGANPNTLVISGAPAPTGFFGGCSANGCDDNIYIAGMAAAGAARYMDCVGVHYNEGIVPPNWTSGDPRSEYYTRYYPSMVDVYWRAFGGQRPLCFTELGYLTPEGYPPLSPGFAWAQNVTVAQQAAWLRQVRDMAARSGRVRLLIIWNVDFREYGEDPMAGFAIIRPDGSCPACAALGG